MSVYLHGLRIKHFRAIGAEPIELAPLKTFNFFIGANNAGKSTVLDFIYKHISRKRVKGEISLIEDIDRHIGKDRGDMESQLAVSPKLILKQIIKAIENSSGEKATSTFEKFVDVFTEDKRVWVEEVNGNIVNRNAWKFSVEMTKEKAKDCLSLNELNFLSAKLNVGSHSLYGDAINSILSAIYMRVRIEFPKVALIPAIRQIYDSDGSEGKELDDFSGRKLIDWLFRIQVPPWDNQAEREPFDKINLLLQTVTGSENAEIAIPASKEHIYVKMDGKTLPLSQVGTGIHHLIMIAAFSTMCKSQILCIEEPELYLHPIMQKKLMKYLSENTDNQYFISTHSAAFIDTPDAAIFHVTHDGDHAAIRQAQLSQHKYEICADLGYRASDIMQANAVIWVEGPSDRIYVRHWIEALAPELTEGMHYSIMFYGGSLLRHLSADDQEVDDFIALRSLNRNLALLMDSDKASSHARITDTKKRLRDAFQKDGGICWITKGREIENYVDKALLESALKDLYKSYDGPSARGDFEHAFYFMRYPPRSKDKTKRETYKDADKVTVSRKVCETKANLDILDLKSRIQEVVNMIRKANDL